MASLRNGNPYERSFQYAMILLVVVLAVGIAICNRHHPAIIFCASGILTLTAIATWKFATGKNDSAERERVTKVLDLIALLLTCVIVFFVRPRNNG